MPGLGLYTAALPWSRQEDQSNRTKDGKRNATLCLPKLGHGCRHAKERKKVACLTNGAGDAGFSLADDEIRTTSPHQTKLISKWIKSLHLKPPDTPQPLEGGIGNARHPGKRELCTHNTNSKGANPRLLTDGAIQKPSGANSQSYKESHKLKSKKTKLPINK